MARRSLSFKITLGAIIFCGLIFLGYYSGLTRYSSSLLISIFNPLIRASSHLADSLGDFFSIYQNQDDIIKQNDFLKSELISLAKKNAVLSLVQKENEILKQELQFVDEYKYNYVVARVVGRSFDFDKNYFLIDKGARHGLSVGLPVTMDQGLVVGRLIRVEENIAEVRLLTDSESQIAVTIIGEEGSAGLAKGEHNINLRIEMLPKEAKIAIGDLVVTSNLNLNTPPGLVLGRVQKIEFSDNNLWQSAVAEPLVDYSNLSLVTIILPANSQ